MVVCLVVPLVFIIAANAFGLGKNYLFLLVLLCPLMHFLMMPREKGRKSCH